MGSYSSPVPLIGLYIAGATLACFLSMLHDTVVGFRSRKRWLPCKLFKLNSLTFAILAVATKLPVDLTTLMPRAQDQLSKLTSTTLICISMGFFMPSIGDMAESELYSNMAALTLFVITVIINVSIQMKTGVIFTFKEEHVIILCFMFILLLVMWSSNVVFRKSFYNPSGCILKQGWKDDVQGPNTMFQRLKLCYMKSYYTDPQLQISQTAHHVTIGVLCLLSCIILIQSVIKTDTYKELMKFKLKEGVCSDYGWSILVVVLVQIMTVLLGTFTVSFRWITMMTQMDMETGDYWHNLFPFNSYWYHKLRHGKLFSLPPSISSRLGLMKKLQRFEDFVGIVLFGIHNGVQLINLLAMSPIYALSKIFKRRAELELTEEEKQYEKVVNQNVIQFTQEWILKLGAKDIKRRMDSSQIDMPTFLIQYLQESASPSGISMLEFGDHHVSCLSMVILVLTTRFILSSKVLIGLQGDLSSIFGEAFVRVLDEGFEVIHYVDGKLNPEYVTSNVMYMLAKDLWMCRDIQSHWLQTKNFKGALEAYFDDHESSTKDDHISESFKIDHIIELMRYLLKDYDSPSSIFLDDEFFLIYNYVKDSRGSFEKIEDVFEHIKKLFVEMLHYHLSRLPLAIFKDVAEASIEECQDKVRLALSFLYKLEPLESHVEWCFPEECKFTRLVTPATRAPDDVTNIEDKV